MRAIVALGRHPENDIVLDDRTLSRFHARLERRGDRYVVVDSGAAMTYLFDRDRVVRSQLHSETPFTACALLSAT